MTKHCSLVFGMVFGVMLVFLPSAHATNHLRGWGEKIENLAQDSQIWLEKRFLNTQNLDGVGFDYSTLSGCLRDASCSDPDEQSFPRLVEYALSTSPEITKAQSEHSANQFHVESARWAFWPTPRFSVSRRPEDDRYFANVGIEQPLWTGGRLTSNLDHSRAQAIASHSQIALSQMNLALNMVELYGTWFNADRRRHSWQQTLKVMDDIMQRVKRLNDAGSLSDTALIQAQSKYDISRAEMFSAEAEVESAVAGLSQMIGVTLQPSLMKQGLVAIPDIVDLEIPKSREDLLETMAAHSPQIVRARTEVAIAEAQARIQKSEVMPEVFLVLERDQVPGAKSDNRAYVGVRSSFGAGLSYGSAGSAAQSVIKAAREGLRAAERQVLQQVSSAGELYRASDRRAESLEKAIHSLKHYYESINRQFAATGKSTYEVMNAVYDYGLHQGFLADAESRMFKNGWKYQLLLNGFSALEQ